MTVHEETKFFYEDLNPGDIWRHRPGRTVSEMDNILFSAMTMNRSSLHFDEVYSSDTPLGGLPVNSLFTLSLVTGISSVTEGTGIANLGFREVTFPKTVFAGDTIYCETEVVERRPSKSRPGEGIVTLEHRGLNQRQELVCRAVRLSLVRMRPTDQAAQADQAAPGATKSDAKD